HALASRSITARFRSTEVQRTSPVPGRPRANRMACGAERPLLAAAPTSAAGAPASLGPYAGLRPLKGGSPQEGAPRPVNIPRHFPRSSSSATLEQTMNAIRTSGMTLGAVRILGLDPGLRRTGWGVVEAQGSRLSHVAHGVIAPKDTLPFAERLAILYDAIEA